MFILLPCRKGVIDGIVHLEGIMWRGVRGGSSGSTHSGNGRHRRHRNRSGRRNTTARRRRRLRHGMISFRAGIGHLFGMGGNLLHVVRVARDIRILHVAGLILLRISIDILLEIIMNTNVRYSLLILFAPAPREGMMLIQHEHVIFW